VTLVVAVGLLAGIGAVARYLVDQFVGAQHASGFPFGTLVVNVTGSFVLGLVTGLSLHAGLAPGPTTALGSGLCGGYTTWSTFGHESVALAEGGAIGRAVGNVVGSLALGLLAAGAGLGLALL
jgi:CrcB protein